MISRATHTNATQKRFGKRLVKSFLPIALVIVLAVVGALSFIVYCVSRPAKRAYVVTPESFSRISGRAIKVTDETWPTLDSRRARGWLLRGAEGAPAVVLLHRYGGDRSWLFNLGVKINETTNFTILWPDLRGHGENPLIKWSSLGGREGDDLEGGTQLSAQSQIRESEDTGWRKFWRLRCGARRLQRAQGRAQRTTDKGAGSRFCYQLVR